jgi:N-acetylmuramoyl-L-alanine amidase
MELFIYLIKVTGCTAAFYLVYHILFSKLTFFTLNRWYLLSALVISMLIPLLHINIQTTLPALDVKPLIVNTNTKTISEATDPVFIAQQPQHHTDWMFVADIAYCTITGLLLLKLLLVLGGIVFKALKYGEKQNGYRLIESRSHSNSSFFKYIFLNGAGLNDYEKEQVICHELAHVRLGHTADNLFTEVLKAVLWFNPFVYLFSKALHQSHEFEVDRHLALQYNSKDYAGLLLKLSNPARVGINNQFSAYGLKTRIQMLFKSQSATARKLSYLLVLPVIIGLVYFLAVERVYAFAQDTGGAKNFVLVLDAGHGGNTGGKSNGVNEQDIALAMVKQIKTIAEQRGIKIILTRSDNTNVPFADRVKPQGDAFVSIHVNSDPGNTPRQSTGMTVLTDRTINKERSQKLAEVMVSQMQKLTGITVSDQVYHQGIYVLRENKAPAILLEIGYLTNKNDVKYITNPQNQQAIAEEFVDAIIAYKNTVATKATGIGQVINNAVRTQVKVSVLTNKLQQAIRQRAIADTAIKVKTGNWMSANNMNKGHMSMLNIQYNNDNPNGSRDNLYEDFKEIRSAAIDSSRVDSKTKAVHLYNAELTTGKFNIKADHIVYDRMDSLISANGNVRLKVSDNKHPNAAPTLLETDSLNIYLNNYYLHRSVIRRVIDKLK